TPSNDPAETTDFTNAFLADVDAAITAYNGAANAGTFARTVDTLTYTHGATDDTVDSMTIALATEDDTLVEGPEDYTLTITAAVPPTTTGAAVAVDATVYTVTTTIIDNDTATWSLTGPADVTEGASASYTLALAGSLQAGETASVDLARSFPGGTPSNDPAETTDFTNAFLADVDAAITAYNGAANAGTFARTVDTLTYTH
ncbi:MAG: hypothetical protein GY820_00760, partial [Gammaproteobacteria bacterium]|nr:hypothetical protein [Gammaproteobacteria bacterium]